MSLSAFGFAALVVALVATGVAVVALVACQAAHLSAHKAAADQKQAKLDRAALLARVGRIASVVVTLALLVCCGILEYCFFAGDTSIYYVLQERTLSTGADAWLYKLAGLWAGRAGSLLFWAFLISLFAMVVCFNARRRNSQLDHMAVLIMNIVLVAFLAVLVFSSDNMPFTVTPSNYFNSDGSLTSSASLLSMNTLLEHWAMAIHPPTLFVGYAGMTVPFAYAIATLIVGDSSKTWVQSAQRYTLFAWLFLGIGIGLGSVWAYVVLGWGGYWGWDAVENASLLSWLVGVALIHTFTVYRQRGAFKRWAVMCSCLAFAFVIVGTFISRSGIVQSVHAFEGDTVSLVFFGALIALSVLAGIVGLAIRWKRFGSDVEGDDDVENMISKDAAYYFNNVIMIIFTLVLTYMTVASALPSWLPFGGQSLSTTSYDAIARPLGIVYLFILSVCPLLGWGRTDRKKFLKQAKIPALCAVVLFALLLAYYLTTLMPAYFDMLSGTGSSATTLAEAGPAPYYIGLSILGLLVASLLFFNALFMLCRGIGSYARVRKVSLPGAIVGVFRDHASTYAGFLAHTSMAVILVGLIGSAMYVTEKTDYMSYDSTTATATEDFTIQDYTLKFVSMENTTYEETYTVRAQVTFDVYKGDAYVGQVSPAIEQNMMTQQQKLDASVLPGIDHDLFVVYRGVSSSGSLSLDVRVNPLIMFVWVGFVMLMISVLLALLGRRQTLKQEHGEVVLPATEAQGTCAEAREGRGPKTATEAQGTCAEAREGRGPKTATEAQGTCAEAREGRGPKTATGASEATEAQPATEASETAPEKA